MWRCFPAPCLGFQHVADGLQRVRTVRPEEHGGGTRIDGEDLAQNEQVLLVLVRAVEEQVALSTEKELSHRSFSLVSPSHLLVSLQHRRATRGAASVRAERPAKRATPRVAERKRPLDRARVSAKKLRRRR